MARVEPEDEIEVPVDELVDDLRQPRRNAEDRRRGGTPLRVVRRAEVNAALELGDDRDQPVAVGIALAGEVAVVALERG